MFTVGQNDLCGYSESKSHKIKIKSISAGATGLMLFIKSAIKIYDTDIFINVTECCPPACVYVFACQHNWERVLVQRHLTTLCKLHLISSGACCQFLENSHHAVGICRWERRNAWEQKPAASSTPLLSSQDWQRWGCTSCSRKNTLSVGKSLVG